MSITLQVVSDEEYKEETEPEAGWHNLYRSSTFVKWQYEDTPYRVIAHLEEDRGHWSALFTTSFPTADSHLIRGNCGGGNAGRTLSTAAAKKFMRKNENGCPPPNEI